MIQKTISAKEFRKTVKPKNKKVEATLQKRICEYIKNTYPDTVFISDCSGLKMSIGVAMQMKSLRSNHAHLDVFIAHKSGQFSGLYLECKKSMEEVVTKKGELRQKEHIQNQSKTMDLLIKQGFRCFFVYNFEMAKMAIDNHLNNNF